MKALVTAGASFLGSHLVNHLISRGHQVVAIDSLTAGRVENLEQALASHHFLLRVLDIADAEALADCFPGVDSVFHLAGAACTAQADDPTLREILRDARATYNVLECCRRFAVRSVVYVTTAESYPPTPRRPVAETAPLLPRCPIALCSALGEQLVLHRARTDGTAASSLRVFEIYGPSTAAPENAGAARPILRATGTHERSHCLEGASPQRFDFVHVHDVVRALVLAADSHLPGDVFNIGTGRACSLWRFAELAGKASFEPRPPRSLAPLCRIANTRKARRVLGWSARIDLENGLRAAPNQPPLRPPAPPWKWAQPGGHRETRPLAVNLPACSSHKVGGTL